MKTDNQELTSKKLNGRYYTPEFIVENVLDLASYHGQAILKKHVIDNSCGDGAFLVAIVKRYCHEFLKHSSDLNVLKIELSTYIHGIEIDNIECRKCVENLNSLIKTFNLEPIQWNVLCADALAVDKFNGKMDFVLGNPPYVRVHNLGETFNNIKEFSFAQNGMTDLYIVFYEIGLKMLSNNGTLGYITPSSFLNSLAGKYMRAFVIRNNLLDRIVDLQHFQAFSATTYSTIAILKKNRKQTTVEYYQFEDRNNFPYYIDTLEVEDFYINSNFYFAKKQKLAELKDILMFKPTIEYFSVKNGFATLADDFFIGDFEFDEFTIPIIKASTGKQFMCLFPYKNGKLVDYATLTKNSKIKDYFENNKLLLSKRSIDNNSDWYGFGRSQGINDVYKCKYAINALLRCTQDIKLVKCDSGVGVYSGLYIITDIPESDLRTMLCEDDFVSYIALLGKYKSGGYYTFSSKDLKNYLEYKYSQRNGFDNEQLTIFNYT